jgi:hypothetical protein
MRFRLRTLFFVVTLLAVAAWLAVEWNAVRARRALLADIAVRKGAYIAPDEAGKDTIYGQAPLSSILFGLDQAYAKTHGEPKDTRSYGPSFLRRWLGDSTIEMIWVPDGMPVENVRSLFPEARLRETTRASR